MKGSYEERNEDTYLILRTSTEHKTATHSVADCSRISTAELGDNLLTLGATMRASPADVEAALVTDKPVNGRD